jgi:eukaryotic-like serine/threonine-protein kinase
MAANVTLTIHGGALDGKHYTFKEPTKCVVGRAEDCLIQLPNNREFQLVSRHHCELVLDPPGVRVCDLGSLNGTFINSRLIGHRPRTVSAESAEPRVVPLFDLHTGDELWVGPVLFDVKVTGAVAARTDAAPANEEPFSEMALAT